MTYEATITYAKPCRQGGIQSNTTSFLVWADNEDAALQQAEIRGAHDPNYLYTILIEVTRTWLF